MITKEYTDELIQRCNILINKLELHNENNVLRYQIGKAHIENIRKTYECTIRS